MDDYKFEAVILGSLFSDKNVVYILKVRNVEYNSYNRNHTEEWLNASVDDVLKYTALKGKP